MLHKICHEMVKIDDKYALFNQVKLGEGFFEIETNKQDCESIAIEIKENDGKYIWGKGIQKQIALIAMAESSTVEVTHKYKHKPNKKVGHIKMQFLKDLFKRKTPAKK